MDSQPTPVLWVLGAGVPLALLLGSALRWVTRGHLLVVTRRGVVDRSVASGPTLRVPLLERTHLLSSGPEDLLLSVRARTRDGGDVRVLATATTAVVAPTQGRAFVEPRAAARDALEAALTRATARLDTSELGAGLDEALDDVRHDADARARPAGAEVGHLELDEIELLLAPGSTPRGPD